MKVRWKVLLIKIIIWLMAEVTLTYLGLDNFADYSEFLDDRNLISLNT
jgi:hypothetical protein